MKNLLFFVVAMFIAVPTLSAAGKCEVNAFTPVSLHKTLCMDWSAVKIVPPNKVKIVAVNPEEIADLTVLKQPYIVFPVPKAPAATLD